MIDSVIYGSVLINNSLLFIAVCLAIYCKSFRIDRLKLFVNYLFFIALLEAVLNILIFVFNFKDTSFTYPFYVTFEFFFISIYLRNALNLSSKISYLIIIVSILMFLEQSVLWYSGQYFDAGVGKVLSHIIFISLVVWIILKDIWNIEKSFDYFILHIGLLLYYSLSLFFFLTLDQLSFVNRYIWIINNLLASILYLTSIYTFWKLRKFN